MYNHSDILIVGDSFVKDRTEPTDWPMALTRMLTGSDNTPLGVGIGGTSWWTARKCIVKALQDQPPKVLVICHTDALRLPSDKDAGLTSGTVLNQTYNTNNSYWYSKEEFDAAAMYYTHLISNQFHEWARSQWYNELDKLTIAVPIVIHLHGFPNYKLDKQTESFTFKHGITSTEILFKLQVRESGSIHGIHPVSFRNHFSPANNVKISKALYNAVMTFDPAKNGTKQDLDLLCQGAK